MNTPGNSDSANPVDDSRPSWKRLFAPGGFEWAFRMRRGDAKSFFAPRDPTGALLRARGRKLDDHPERYLGSVPAAAPLVGEAWTLARGWEQVVDPPGTTRDLIGLSRQWEADILIMDNASMSVVATAVCFPSSWDPGQAIGKSLREVHGAVPRLNSQIGDMIDRFLAKISPGASFRRENWSFTRSADLDYHPARKRPPLDDSLTLDEVFLRIEHQLFTGIPGGVLMGLRIETCPLRDLAADPATWRATAEKLRTMPAEVARYKSIDAAIPALLRKMDALRSLAPES